MVRRKAEKLFQYYRKGRSQCRYSSSMATKESQPSGVIKKAGEGVLKTFYIGAVGGVGYVLGGLLITSEAPKVEDARIVAAKMLKNVAKSEIRADEMREWCLNRRIQQAKFESMVDEMRERCLNRRIKQAKNESMADEMREKCLQK